MSIKVLPSEVLVKIFKNLDGTGLLACRRVNRRWNALVNHYFKGEEFWRKQCKLKYRYLCKEAHRKANISWRELHNSLDIWDRIQECKVQVYILASPPTDQYYFTNNDIISCSHDVESPSGKQNCIAYYDLSSRICVDSIFVKQNFTNYYEDDFTLIYDYFENMTLAHMMMVSWKTISGHQIENLQYGTRFFVCKDYVYYQSEYIYGQMKSSSLWRALFNVSDQNDYEKDNLFIGYSCDILDVTQDKGEAITYILRTDCTTANRTLNIIRVIDCESPFVEIYTKVFMRYDVINTLKAYNFHWTNPRTLNWLLNNREYKNDPRLVVPDIGAALSYNKYVIVATKTSPIYINFYKNPYNWNHELIIDRVDPVLSINLNDYLTSELKDRPDANVKDIGVTEIFGGHRVVLLYLSQIVVLHLTDADELEFASVSSPDQSVQNLSCVTEPKSDEASSVTTLMTARRLVRKEGKEVNYSQSAQASTSKQPNTTTSNSDKGSRGETSTSDEMKKGATPKQKIKSIVKKNVLKYTNNSKESKKGNKGIKPKSKDGSHSSNEAKKDKTSETKDSLEGSKTGSSGNTTDNKNSSDDSRVAVKYDSTTPSDSLMKSKSDSTIESDSRDKSDSKDTSTIEDTTDTIGQSELEDSDEEHAESDGTIAYVIFSETDDEHLE